MPIKSYRPYTPSRRTLQIADFSEITKTEPEKALTVPVKRTRGPGAEVAEPMSLSRASAQDHVLGVLEFVPAPTVSTATT